MKRALLLLIFAMPASLSLAACAAAQQTQAPSLAKRPIEGRFDVAPPAIVIPPPGPLPSDLAGRLARWEADAASGQQAFAAERDATAALVAAAAGAPVASERWVVAQQAISRLTAARAPLSGALADIDRLYIERTVDEAVDGLPDIYALRDRIAEMESAQDAILQALSAALPGQ
ncbi:hypothetical protein [Sphingopyxis macrogoltabida]|uniref:Uncharacterized protein n=1 Tax=Sphingopyxis macrogoltabida TaxID=33050 RepID=A0AAC9AWS2_SPHMC|nr:hypothetical protein [Sphingopyxis macrogoltabida]ALJ14977.1 hypothetical protein LH19_19065 [Sphingopyxis macrogoltabida]AMU91225.1 hypothetical protein ATM17_19615 [Sphingopyxis macrogoltabida]